MSLGRKPGNERRREAIADPELWKWFKGERLEVMPASPANRRRVLEHVVGRFEEGREYAEGEVNVILSAVHSDFATLRRYLVDGGILRRDGGRYRRVSSAGTNSARR